MTVKNSSLAFPVLCFDIRLPDVAGQITGEFLFVAHATLRYLGRSSRGVQLSPRELEVKSHPVPQAPGTEQRPDSGEEISEESTETCAETWRRKARRPPLQR